MANQLTYYDETKKNVIDFMDIDRKTQVWRWMGVVNEFYRDNKTQDELKDDLRNQRKAECFPIINRGQLWYESLTSSQKEELSKWYQDWLNVTETMVAPTKPEWLK